MTLRRVAKNVKGYFFQAGQCTALSSFRVRKMVFSWKSKTSNNLVRHMVQMHTGTIIL